MDMNLNDHSPDIVPGAHDSPYMILTYIDRIRTFFGIIWVDWNVVCASQCMQMKDPISHTPREKNIKQTSSVVLLLERGQMMRRTEQLVHFSHKHLRCQKDLRQDWAAWL